MKAVIPAAGLGTRLLPATKVVPKELLPVGGKPAIQWVLEEAVAAGLREFVVVVSPRKTIVKDYLTPLGSAHPLVGVHPGLAELNRLLNEVEITFAEQPEELGLGDAILRCRDLIGNRPFALLLPDNVCDPDSRITAKLMELHSAYGKSCLALQKSAGRNPGKSVILADAQEGAIFNIRRVPSEGEYVDQGEFQGVGRYILEPIVFDYLQQSRSDAEFDEGDALDRLARSGRLMGLLTTGWVNHLGEGARTMEGGTDLRKSWQDPWKFDFPGHESLLLLHLKLREEVQRRWNRAVPFADELFDRWERAAFLGFGKGASIYDSSLVLGEVQAGEGTWIGPFTVLDGRGGLSIGKYCSISAGVHLYSHDTVKWALTGGRAKEVRSPTRIGDCCYIGPMSIVSRGVAVGEHSLIGANSFVRHDVPPFSIAVGSPARVVGRVELHGEDDVRFVYDKDRLK